MAHSTSRALPDFTVAAGFILLCQSAGLLGTLVSNPGSSPWIDSLAKPWFYPPGWLFAPVWIMLYSLMGVAAFLIWKQGPRLPDVRAALELFGIQLLLNALWTPVFFGAKSITGGLFVILLLLAALVFTMARFYRLSPLAGGLLSPYLLWVCFATLLNASLWILN